MSDYGRVRLDRAEVTGERVRLRAISSGDAQVCFELVHGMGAITDWIEWDGPETVEELEEGYSAWLTDTEELTQYKFAIVDRDTDAWAGSIDIRHLTEDPVASIGYFIGVPFQGRGLGSEAVHLVVELAFRELAVLLVRAEVFSGNHPSMRVLEKAGLHRDQGQESSFEKGGKIIEEHVYSISRAEWETRPACDHVWTTRLREGS